MEDSRPTGFLFSRLAPLPRAALPHTGAPAPTVLQLWREDQAVCRKGKRAVAKTTAWRPLPWRARRDGRVLACARPPSLSGTFLWPASFFSFGWDRGDLRLLVQSLTEFLLFPALAMSFLAGLFALESSVKRDRVGTTLRHLVSLGLKTRAAHVRLYGMPSPPSLVGGRHGPPMGNQ